jgi:hypothetical protein
MRFFDAANAMQLCMSERTLRKEGLVHVCRRRDRMEKEQNPIISKLTIENCRETQSLSV